MFKTEIKWGGTRMCRRGASPPPSAAKSARSNAGCIKGAARVPSHPGGSGSVRTAGIRGGLGASESQKRATRKEQANGGLKVSSLELEWKLYFKSRKHESATHRYCSIIRRRGWCQDTHLRIISAHYCSLAGGIGKKHVQNGTRTWRAQGQHQSRHLSRVRHWATLGGCIRGGRGAGATLLGAAAGWPTAREGWDAAGKGEGTACRTGTAGTPT